MKHTRRKLFGFLAVPAAVALPQPAKADAEFNPIAVTLEQGGNWYAPGHYMVKKAAGVHAIVFSDGRIWDTTIGGWRPDTEESRRKRLESVRWTFRNFPRAAQEL